MSYTTTGLHLMTAIASDPQRNLDFYTQILGLRLVKLTVNFDDPSSYHFYYGDTRGTPGTILTFFSWPGARQSRSGQGVVETTHLRAPFQSLGYWEDRLQSAGVATQLQGEVLKFADFDGLAFEIIEQDRLPSHVEPWTRVVPASFALGGMSGVSLRVGALESTAAVLEDQLGFERQNEVEFKAKATGDFVRLLPDSNAVRAGMGSGGVHHVAFRSSSESQQRDWLSDLRTAGFNASPVMDRDYFRSIYFREPGGVLFEIATDAPGFTVDEPLDSLGKSLKLPAQYEAHRAQIEAALAPLVLPEVTK